MTGSRNPPYFCQQGATALCTYRTKRVYMLRAACDYQLVVIALAEKKRMRVPAKQEGSFSNTFADRYLLAENLGPYPTLLADMAQVPQESIARVYHGRGVTGLGDGLTELRPVRGRIVDLHQGMAQ